MGSKCKELERDFQAGKVVNGTSIEVLACHYGLSLITMVRYLNELGVSVLGGAVQATDFQGKVGSARAETEIAKEKFYITSGSGGRGGLSLPPGEQVFNLGSKSGSGRFVRLVGWLWIKGREEEERMLQLVDDGTTLRGKKIG